MDNDQALYPDSVSIPQNVLIPYTLASTVNYFFETKKLQGTNHLGMFFDWYDIRFDNLENISWDDFVQTIMAEECYDQP